MGIAMTALANAEKAARLEQKCSKHGLNLYTHKNHEGEQVTYCPQCQAEALAALQERFDQEARKSIIERKFRENSLVNPKMWACTFGNFTAEEGSREAALKKRVAMAAEAFAANKKVAHHAVLYGQPGAGKSHLAMALMQKVHETSGQTMAFINISRLFSRIKNSFDDPSEYWTKETALKTMTSVDLLCIDDLGTESSMGRSGQEATKWAQDVIYDVLENQDRIIITTNLSEREMKRVYDAKIFSRIFANSKNTRFDFSGIADKRLVGV